MTDTDGEQVYEVGDEGVGVIEVTSGDVRVSGWDKPHVAVESSKGEVRVQQDGPTTTISTKPAGSSDVVAKVPEWLRLQVRGVSGDLRVDNISGGIGLLTMSGDVTASAVRGKSEVRTVSGDISLYDCELSSLKLATVSGDSVIESSLDFEGKYEVRSVSGGVRMLLPPGQACTVHSSSVSGSLRCELPHKTEKDGWGKRVVQVNGGGVDLKVRSTSGSLLLAQTDGDHRGVAAHLEDAAEVSSTGAHDTKPLGSEPKAEPFGLDDDILQEDGECPSVDDERMSVLKSIEEGEISVSDGLARLRSLE